MAQETKAVVSKLRKHLKKFPHTALIGWKNNPDLADEFDKWFEKLRLLLGELGI